MGTTFDTLERTPVTPAAQPDPAKLEAFMGKMVGDMGAANGGALVILGERLGLYKALAEGGRATSRELADRTGLPERYVRDWLSAKAAAGSVEYDAEVRTLFISPAQVIALADENSPVYMVTAFHITPAVYISAPQSGTRPVGNNCVSPCRN